MRIIESPVIRFAIPTQTAASKLRKLLSGGSTSSSCGSASPGSLETSPVHAKTWVISTAPPGLTAPPADASLLTPPTTPVCKSAVLPRPLPGALKLLTPNPSPLCDSNACCAKVESILPFSTELTLDLELTAVEVRCWVQAGLSADDLGCSPHPSSKLSILQLLTKPLHGMYSAVALRCNQLGRVACFARPAVAE